MKSSRHYLKSAPCKKRNIQQRFKWNSFPVIMHIRPRSCLHNPRRHSKAIEFLHRCGYYVTLSRHSLSMNFKQRCCYYFWRSLVVSVVKIALLMCLLQSPLLVALINTKWNIIIRPGHSAYSVIWDLNFILIPVIIVSLFSTSECEAQINSSVIIAHVVF